MQSGRLLALLAVLAAPSAAQSYANLYGRILDTSEGGIPKAAISVVSEDTGFRRATQSDSSGVYSVGALRPGSYKITARKDGFRTVVRFAVALAPASTARADFVLPVGPVEETITVEGIAPMIQQGSAAVGIHSERGEFSACRSTDAVFSLCSKWRRDRMSYLPHGAMPASSQSTDNAQTPTTSQSMAPAQISG